MFLNYLYTSSTSKSFREHFVDATNKYIKYFKLNKKKSHIIDIGSNDGVALKPFIKLGFKKILGIEPAKDLAKFPYPMTLVDKYAKKKNKYKKKSSVK